MSVNGKEDDELMSASDIEAIDDIEYRVINGWGDKKMRIKSLSAGDLIEWTEASDGEAKRTAGLRLVIQSVVDKDGNQVLNMKHLPMLRKKSHKKVNEVVNAILELNGMTVRAAADVKKD